MRQFYRAVLTIGALVVSPICTHTASATNYQVIYSFCSVENCADGAYGGAPIVIGDPNHLYGITQTGGNGFGTVFELKHGKTGWSETVLYSFCPAGLGNCTDGSGPSSVFVDKSGNLFGTTLGGGSSGGGTVFELARAGHGQWTFGSLYSFCVGDCPNGPLGLSYAGSETGISYDGRSPIFGTMGSGGKHGWGAVVRFTHKANIWSEREIYGFCSEKNCKDGAKPYSPVLVSSSGKLYGTTASGGSGDEGALYELTSLTKNRWQETVLYPFCSLINCSDGYLPEGRPLLDSNNNIYGTTTYGGTQCDSDYQCGVVFEFAADGRESTVHNFCTAGKCTDGTGPTAGLISAPTGDLFGTTSYGGEYGSDIAGGTIFKLNGGSFEVLYSFCSSDMQCADGSRPGQLTMDTSGNLYGTTVEGGNASKGVVFEVTP